MVAEAHHAHSHELTPGTLLPLHSVISQAKEECTAESGIEIATHLVEQSGDNVGSALMLLDLIGQANNRFQMRPVFVPLRDGKVDAKQLMMASFVPLSLARTHETALTAFALLMPSPQVMEMSVIHGKEVFRALDGTLPPNVANPSGKTRVRGGSGNFESNLGWSESVKVDQGAGADVLEESEYTVSAVGKPRRSSSTESPVTSFTKNRSSASSKV